MMKLRKYSLFAIILLLIFSFSTYSMKKTEAFNIDNEWTISLPEDWQMEGRSPYQQYYSFYPNIPFYSMIKIYSYDIAENQNIDLLEDLKKKYPNSKIKEKKKIQKQKPMNILLMKMGLNYMLFRILF